VLEGKAGLRRQKPIRLTEHVKAYLLHTAKSNSTSYKDRAVLDTFVASVGDRPIDEVSPFHIERWKQERAEDVSKSTVNRELNIIRGCFSRAVEWGRLAISPMRTVKTYNVDDSRVRVLTDDELAQRSFVTQQGRGEARRNDVGHERPAAVHGGRFHRRFELEVPADLKGEEPRALHSVLVSEAAVCPR